MFFLQSQWVTVKFYFLGSNTNCNDIYPGYDPVSSKSPLTQNVTSYYNALVDIKCQITKKKNFYNFIKYQFNKIANIDNIFAH